MSFPSPTSTSNSLVSTITAPEEIDDWSLKRLIEYAVDNPYMFRTRMDSYGLTTPNNPKASPLAKYEMSMKQRQYQLLAKYPTIKLVEVKSGRTVLFVPVLLATKISGVMSNILEDMATVAQVTSIKTGYDQVFELPISDNYSTTLIDYGHYLLSKQTLKFLLEIGKPLQLIITEFLFDQREILADYSQPPGSLNSRVKNLYLQFQLASYLEDTSYSNYVMDKVMTDWENLWPKLVNGPIPEVNYDIYTRTPWPYLPADLITSPNFIEAWTRESTYDFNFEGVRSSRYINNIQYSALSGILRSVGEDSIPSEFCISASVDYDNKPETDRWDNTRMFNQVGVRPQPNHSFLEDIRVIFYPDSFRIRYEEVKFRRPFSYINQKLSGELPDRITDMVKRQLATEEGEKVFKVITYWKPDGKLDKREYHLSNRYRELDGLINSWNFINSDSRQIITKVF